MKLFESEPKNQKCLSSLTRSVMDVAYKIHFSANYNFQSKKNEF